MLAGVRSSGLEAILTRFKLEMFEKNDTYYIYNIHEHSYTEEITVHNTKSVKNYFQRYSFEMGITDLVCFDCIQSA